MLQSPPGDALHPVAARLLLGVAPPVALERGAVRVELESVELDHDALGGSEEVDLEPFEHRVGLRARQAAPADKVAEEPLRPRAGERRTVVEQPAELARSAALGSPIECGANVRRTHQPQDPRPLERGV